MHERSDALALRYGAIIGAAGGVLGLLLVILITVTKGDPGVALAGCVGFLAGFALLFTPLFFGALFAGIGAGLGALGSLVGRAGFRREQSRDVALTNSD